MLSRPKNVQAVLESIEWTKTLLRVYEERYPTETDDEGEMRMHPRVAGLRDELHNARLVLAAMLRGPTPGAWVTLMSPRTAAGQQEFVTCPEEEAAILRARGWRAP